MADPNMSHHLSVNMVSAARPLTAVPEVDEVHVSPVSSKDDGPAFLFAETARVFSPAAFSSSGYSSVPLYGSQDEQQASVRNPSHGTDELGISHTATATNIRRVPVGSREEAAKSPDTPRSDHRLLESPSTSQVASPTTPGYKIASPRSRFSPRNVFTSPKMRAFLRRPSYDKEMLTQNAAPIGQSPAPGAPNPVAQTHNDSPKQQPDDEYFHDDFDEEAFNSKFTQPPDYCWSRKDIYSKRNTWLPVTIFGLSVYSTIMSGIWVVVAIVQPRWGHAISSSARLSPSTATLLCALISKTIELSFTTVFIAFIGQVLTRRSLIRKSRGMTLAEMTMRNYVIQPGSLLTSPAALSYTILTVTGALCLSATFSAMFYTTASDAMVAPKLKYGKWEYKQLSGYVQASYANPNYIRDTCPSLLTYSDINASESCMNVEFNGESHKSLLAFMSVWTGINDNGTTNVEELAKRPAGTAVLYDNTTMTGSWVETENSNVTALFEKWGRVINNATLAMPHPGVYAAATSPVNGILQPNDLAGVGEYAIRASVVSPSINAMCVDMTTKELAPLIYTTWPNAKTNKTEIPNQLVGYRDWGGDVPGPIDKDGNPDYLNRTVVDKIFKWGSKYSRLPPVFQQYPLDFNMIVNASNLYTDAIYVLGKSAGAANYTLCEMRSWLSITCSTQFNISGTGGSNMQSHCEDPNDANSYTRSFDPPPPQPAASKEWQKVATQWALSIDLNSGIQTTNASNGRILTDLALHIPTDGSLPAVHPYLPSLAETLAVYGSSTLVYSSIGTPFVHFWGYKKPGNILGDPGALEHFNASLITQMYTSGHTSSWQGIFYLVLIFIFAINLFCLSYLVMRSGLVTDFTEPQNMFALAFNSPPSAQLKGACGGGPEKRDLVVPWRVAYAPSANHYFFEEANDKPWKGRYRHMGATLTPEYGDEVRGQSYRRLSQHHGWL